MLQAIEDMQAAWGPPAGRPLGASYWVRGELPWLPRVFGLEAFRDTLAPGIHGVVGWGGRFPARYARWVARMRGLPHWSAEDGFLRSVALGKSGAVPWSVVVDDLGLYFDARRPSRLERLVREASSGGHRTIGGEVRERVVRHGLTKYNHLPLRPPAVRPGGDRRILLVDQVAGDQSIPAALADAGSFARMASEAAATGARCLVRTHPDVMAGYRRGYLADLRLDPVRFEPLSDAVAAPCVIDAVDEVWTVSSQMGFDALMRGKRVRTFGAPFYAGWGLTEDRPGPAAAEALARRAGARPTVDDLVAAALVLYPRYRDPASGAPLDVHAAIDGLVAERAAAGAR